MERCRAARDPDVGWRSAPDCVAPTRTGDGRPVRTVVMVERRATSGPHIGAGASPNRVEVIVRCTCDCRNTGPGCAVVMNEGLEAHRPYIRCGAAPHAEEPLRRRARNARPD